MLYYTFSFQKCNTVYYNGETAYTVYIPAGHEPLPLLCVGTIFAYDPKTTDPEYAVQFHPAEARSRHLGTKACDAFRLFQEMEARV